MCVFSQPPTAKMHAIIERTANFVCKQGAQFEIMLKAKQARNSQFDFLRFDHYLNPYYKFIQKAMKEGRYPVLAGDQRAEKQSTRGEAAGRVRGASLSCSSSRWGWGPGRAEVLFLPVLPRTSRAGRGLRDLPLRMRSGPAAAPSVGRGSP